MADDGEASTSSLTEGMFDAFLSFRGKDTRNLFTDFLYRELAKYQKLQVFRDEPGLEPGDEIQGTLMEAIKRSRMFIVVMSPNYLESRWCLMELKEMLKYSNKKKRSIFPIFYHVEPSEMRLRQTEESKKAMETHEQRYGKDTVDSWKSALDTVSGLSGDHIVEDKDYESEVMEKIAKKVLAKHREIKQVLTKFDSEFDAVESLLNLESLNTLGMVGIYNEDGKIDTTTFAFELYYQIKYEFQEASFLSDVSTQVWKNTANGLENLKKEVLSDMDVEESTKQRLQHRRVLLVLEGVDSIEHLELLLGELGIRDLFGPDSGSRIIITTENKSLFQDSPVMNGAKVEPYCIREGEYDGNRGSFTMMEENVVGLKEEFSEVIKQLKEENSAGNVVSIVGMAGLGKTTLARKVYTSSEARQLFPCRAWATISKQPIWIEVFRELLKCMKVRKSEYENSSEEELKEKVRNCLNGKKYLVVLDDLWETKVWDLIKDSLPPDRKNSSMILITTRNSHVAYHARSKDPHNRPNLLDKDQSWEMFQNIVFGGEECPDHLTPIGRSIAFDSCKGLPLAIKTVAGLVVMRERTEVAWTEIKNLLPYWDAFEDEECVKAMQKILKLSYDDLPDKIKPCFLYLAVYPEDKKIRVRDLMELWIIEGFIQQPRQTRRRFVAPQPEDIAEKYMKEMVYRNVVQVASKRSDGEGFKTCQIHDLFRDLCISESARNSNARELSFSCNTRSYACSATCNESRTCSLFLFGDPGNWSSHIPAEESFRVHVLYFSSFRLNVAEEEDMQRLIHLRYFRAGLMFSKYLDHRVNKLETLDRMEELETLHLLEHKVFEIRTAEIKQLKHLRSVARVKLLGERRGRGGGGGERVIMRNLQTAYHVSLDPESEFLNTNGFIFPNLTTLGLDLSFFQKVGMEPLNLHLLKSLRKLKLTFYDSEENLFSLDEIVLPPNLTKISFSNSTLNYSDMDALGRITSLQILKLFVVNCGRDTAETLDFGGAGSFPQLQVLILTDVYVKSLAMDEGAMPRLRRVVICDCKILEEVPEQMISLGSNFEIGDYEDSDSDSDHDSQFDYGDDDYY
ncbi:hypothetical protein PIB30_066421 [Stylosanthes scabra]|uniref:TIR domain-containing protein n=1 Tax=Stylosanthes scabra TaxID=79078 RepID=A0ABU6TM38_9FABA|nr:hypothetical protein [Stylosanthes scabra]